MSDHDERLGEIRAKHARPTWDASCRDEIFLLAEVDRSTHRLKSENDGGGAAMSDLTDATERLRRMREIRQAANDRQWHDIGADVRFVIAEVDRLERERDEWRTKALLRAERDTLKLSRFAVLLHDDANDDANTAQRYTCGLNVAPDGTETIVVMRLADDGTMHAIAEGRWPSSR